MAFSSSFLYFYIPILNAMTYTEYTAIFDQILSGRIQHAPYDDPHFVEYTKLNHSRMHRWEKTGILTEECKSTIQSISTPMHWILITEPWCGDAAHSVPFLAKMAAENPLIHLEIQLRDSEDSEIESYLTNGGKSIPILIVRNSFGEDLFVWGPRPEACRNLHHTLKAQEITLEDLKTGLQQWYNADKGLSIQEEMIDKIRSLS
jgi:hypothetical protein